MSFDIIAAESMAKSPKTATPRRGRGFSISEAMQAGLSVKEARQMGLLIDIRRKTLHSENVAALKQYMKEIDEMVVEVSKPKKATAPKKSDEKIIEELTQLRAVRKADAPKLITAGIKSMSDLAYCDITKVSKKTGIKEDRVTAMVKAALKKI
ncbi:MAG: ribosomal protein L13e [Candidatus Hodarchaeota archaeon]